MTRWWSFPNSAMYEVSDRIAQFALEAKLPSVSGWSPFAQKGLLMTYGRTARALVDARTLHGSHSKGCQTRRSASRGAGKVLPGDQPEDSKEPWARNSTDAATRADEVFE